MYSVRCDNGIEFMGERLTYMQSRGIHRELGGPYTPEQFGGAKRLVSPCQKKGYKKNVTSY